jgi:hypothetical protein
LFALLDERDTRDAHKSAQRVRNCSEGDTMKLIDQYDILMQEHRKRGEEIVAATFPELPQTVYCVGSRYEVEEWCVFKVAANPIISGAWFEKRPTRKTIAAVKAAPDITKDDICLHVQKGGTSTGVKYKDIGKRFFFSKEDADAKSVELRKIYVAKDGQFNCRYCNKATDSVKKVKRRIISRSYPGMGQEFEYCSSECGGYDQMAHEG